MPINSVGRWVKGHQDDMSGVETLDWWGRMNVRCDQLAKAHSSLMINVQQTSMPHEGWFPKANVRVFVKGGKLTSMKKGVICDLLTFNKMVDYWIKKNASQKQWFP